MKRTVISGFLVLLLCAARAEAYPAKLVGKEANQYVKNMSCDFARGFSNVSRSPLEIYNAEKEYSQEQKGRPVIRHITGFVDGSFRAIERAGSGLWDFVAGLLPGDQDGIPARPETIPIAR
ncbi:MAG: hypothetical protein WC352_02010 [Candidatus Omnitrophota bacterium]|jgi:hypothetical protein